MPELGDDRDDGRGRQDQQLPDRVYNSVSDIAGSAYQIGWVGGDVNVYQEPVRAVPHQVPAASARFVDRARYLSFLDESTLAADRGGPTRIVVLSGLPGVGKSALVRQWVHGTGGRFDGGELYADFAAVRHRSAAGVADALAGCLRGLGVQDRYIPAGLAERESLFRSRTAGRPMLVVLDDVAEPAHVYPLVPNAAGSLVLVTSEDQLGELATAGATLLPLDPLDADSGRELLATVCGAERVSAEPDAAARVVTLCGGLPIALQVAAVRLLTRPGLTVAALAEELARQSLGALTLRGEPVVSAAFSVSYQSLPGDAARLYRYLGVLPCLDFTAELAAVVCESGQDAVTQTLEVLASARLVDEGAQRRYRMHHLVHAHAAECAEEAEPLGERVAALRRVVRFYLRRAALADRLVMGDRLRLADHDALLSDVTDPFGDAEHAQRWLLAERANLVPVLRAAARSGWDTAVWQLAEALTPFFLNTRYSDDMVDTLDMGVDAAQRAGNTAVEARLRSLLSRALADLGELDRAGAQVETAVRLAEGCDHLVLRASVWEFYGRYLDLTDRPRARLAYQRSIELNSQAGEPRGRALARYFLGCSLDVDGQHAEALDMLSESRDTFVGLGDERMAARALVSVGVAHGHLGQFAEARRALDEAGRVLAARGYTHYEAQAAEALADVLDRVGERDAARRHLRRAWQIHVEAGSPRAEVLRRRLGDDTEV